MKQHTLIFILGGILLLGIIGYFIQTGLFQTASQKSSGKIEVSTSFYPLYFFASQIGGDKANVRNITPTGTEPHDYEPTAQDIARIEKSDLLILNGGVESWENQIKDSLKDSKVLIIAAGEGLLSKEITEDGEKKQDPHIWLNPTLAKKEAERIAEGYIKVDPINSEYYQDNQRKLAEKLDQLDQKFKQGLQNCKSRNIITTHVAFAYLASSYGLSQVAISGLSPEAEPSLAQLTEITKFARENNVKYIFFESLVSPKLAETIANEIGAKTLVLDPLEGLSEDDIKAGKNYFNVMEENLINLQIALECSK